MDRNKKIIIGVVVGLGVVALGLGAYFAWKNRAVIGEIIPTIGGEQIAPLEKKEGRLNAVSSREVADYWVLSTASTSVIMYADDSGSIFNVEDEGDVLLYEQSIPNIGSMYNTYDGALALIRSKQQAGDIFHIFDARAKMPGSRISGIEEIALSPTDHEAAFFMVENNVMKLKVQQADLIGVSDSKNAKTILMMISGGFDLQWPQKESIYLIQKPSADYMSDMWKVDVKAKTIRKFLSGNGLMVKWSKFGDVGLLFTTTPDRKHSLALIDASGTVTEKLNFITMPDKCVIESPSQLYCAVSRDQEILANMQLPDDYLKRAVYFKEGIYQIDTEKNTIRALFEDEAPDIDATDLTVLDDKILFINRYDRKLYSLKLQ